MQPREPENPIVRIKVPIFHTTVPRYVSYGCTPRFAGELPRALGIASSWPDAPELDFRLYKIQSPHWSGTIKVRKILLDEFGEHRAVPFTVWGYILKEHGEKWEPLFEKHGRHEVRKQFINSIRFEAADV